MAEQETNYEHVTVVIPQFVSHGGSERLIEEAESFQYLDGSGRRLVGVKSVDKTYPPVDGLPDGTRLIFDGDEPYGTAVAFYFTSKYPGTTFHVDALPKNPKPEGRQS